MQLTPLQLEIQQRADKTLSFGCMIYSSRHGLGYILGEETLYFKKSDKVIRGYDCPNIIGHPMNWGRLCYLINTGGGARALNAYVRIDSYMLSKNKECLQQTVLERPVELQELVLAFLKTLGN